MRKNKGFTLIELLVVIAIIGILSSIVLVSMNSTRAKAKDARVQASIAQVRAIAETLYDGATYPSSFVTPSSGATCVDAGTPDDNLYKLDQDVRAQNGITNCATPVAGQIIIQKTLTTNVDQAYRAFAKLPSQAATIAWCVDSAGNSKQITTIAGGIPNVEGSGVAPTCDNADN